MEKPHDFMKTTPLFRLLMSMSVPMMLSMLIQALYNIIDSIYVARLGTDALTAVSLAFPLQNVIISVAVGIGVGISSAISICLGAGKKEDANRTASIGMALSVFHCLLFILLGVFVTRPFLSLFTTKDTVLTQACQYTYIVLCLSFGCILQVAMEKIFQGIGEMKITMCLLASGCIINIILDPILIFGLFGFPALGVSGAAIATVIGQISAFLLYIVVYKRRTFAVSIHPKYVSFDKHIIAQIYSVGIPSSIMMTLPSILVSILNRILISFSDLYVAALGIYFKLQTFIYMPANGIVQGLRPIVGYNYGAGETRRVRLAIRYSLFCVGAIMLLGTILSLLIPGPIFALFKADPALAKAGSLALRVISGGFLISSIGIVYAGVFEGLGRGKHSLTISLLRQFLITIPVAFALSGILGPLGVWIAFPAGEIVASIVAFFLMKRFEGGVYAPL